MGDRLTEMRVFVRVARLGSFAAAARELRLSTSAASRRVSELERALGARLIQRTTRQLKLTEEGAAYLERSERILEEIDELESTLADRRVAPRGRLRVAAGVSFGQEQILPLLPAFLARYPDLVVELELSDRFVDLVAEGIDVAIRIGRLADSSLVARRLATSRSVLCASPAYLRRAGDPATPAELSQHPCVVDRNAPRAWTLVGADGSHQVVPEGPLHVNSAHAVRDAVLAGIGIGLVPLFVAGANLADGSLAPVLPSFKLGAVGVHAVYPHTRQLSPKVRHWVDHLAESFGDPPGWERGRTSDASG